MLLESNEMMDAKNNQSESRSLFGSAKKAVMSISIGLWVAVTKINTYAQAVFSERGMFAELEARLTEKLKNTNVSQIGQAFKESRSDVDIGWMHGGVFSELSHEYQDGVKAIFREQGVGNFVDKWRKVLTPEQRTKTLMFSAGTAIAIGAFLFLYDKKEKPAKPEAAHVQSHADRVIQKRVIEASVPSAERA